jgi:hypothetical protein
MSLPRFSLRAVIYLSAIATEVSQRLEPDCLQNDPDPDVLKFFRITKYSFNKINGPERICKAVLETYEKILRTFFYEVKTTAAIESSGRYINH